MTVHFMSPRMLFGVVKVCRQIALRLPNPMHRRLKKPMWGILLTASFLLVCETLAYGQRSLHPTGNQDEHIIYLMIPPDVSREDVIYAKQPLKNRLLRLVKERQALEKRLHEEAVKLDRIVVFTDHNNLPILPDFDAARRRRNEAGSNRAPSSLTTNDLTFTFDSPNHPWTAQELETLNSILSDFYPTAKDVYGDPAFNITVNVRKDPTITFAGLYFPSLNEMVIRNGSNFDVVCHEMIHAFRDDNIIGFNSYEEGMTRAAEVEVFNRLADYVHAFDENHSYTYDVYYEGLNRQKIGSRNGNFFQGYVSALLRYQLSGYAWAKVFLENTGFFREFNAQLYARTLIDPTTTSTESTLLEIAAGVQSMVEGDTFLTWYGQQGVFNTSPPTDYFLYQRINQFTIDYFQRNSFGSEIMQSNATLQWEVYDYQGTLLDSGSGVTSNGHIFFSPTIPFGYSGRIKVVANTLSPNGPVSDTSLRSAGSESGVFGIMAEDTSGTITIMSLDNPMPPVSLNVTQGAFFAPSLASSKGRFLAVFTAPSGGKYLRRFTKDASNYFLYFAVGLSAPNQFFIMNGGAGSVNVTAPAGQSWTATSNESWITITSAGNFSGNGAVSFLVGENTTLSARKGILTVAGHTLTVVQDGGLGENCIYSRSPTFESFPASGGAGRVNVLSEGRCAWEATTDDSWITITSGGIGIGNGTVTYAVAANMSATGRQGMINISGKVFTVKQKGI